MPTERASNAMYIGHVKLDDSVSQTFDSNIFLPFCNRYISFKFRTRLPLRMRIQKPRKECKGLA